MNDMEITDADNVESQSLAAHVAMCRMRHENIGKRMGRIEYMAYAAAGSVIMASGKVLLMAPETLLKIGNLIMRGG